MYYYSSMVVCSIIIVCSCNVIYNVIQDILHTDRLTRGGSFFNLKTTLWINWGFRVYKTDFKIIWISNNGPIYRFASDK